MTKATAKATSKYTAVHEARIREVAEAKGEALAQADAQALAKEFGFTDRSVIAKINRMEDVAYARKARVTKTGAPVERKEDLVAEIATVVTGNLEGLDKAPKVALEALRDALLNAA